MTWLIYGDPWASGELSNTSKFQTVIFNRDLILRGIRCWVIGVGDPVFTSLNCKIYSNDDSSGSNTPVKLITTSTNTVLKTDMFLTEDHVVKEIFFTFGDISFQENDKFNFVINGVGYVPAGDNFLAWRQDWTDNVYDENFTATTNNINISPFSLTATIGSDF